MTDSLYIRIKGHIRFWKIDRALSSLSFSKKKKEKEKFGHVNFPVLKVRKCSQKNKKLLHRGAQINGKVSIFHILGPQ